MMTQTIDAATVDEVQVEGDLTITSVSYSRLVNLGNYENEKVQASARVADGQDPDVVLGGLKTWVSERVTDVQGTSRLDNRVWDLRGELGDLERRISEARQKWNAVKPVLAAHGIDLPDFEELPF
jgi:hypothetical protein